MQAVREVDQIFLLNTIIFILTILTNLQQFYLNIDLTKVGSYHLLFNLFMHVEPKTTWLLW